MGKFMQTHKNKAQTSIPQKRANIRATGQTPVEDKEFDVSPSRRVKTSDYYGQLATFDNVSRNQEFSTLSNFVKDNLSPPISSVVPSR